MDADGSGAIDAEELHEVFMVMGIKAPKAKVQEVLESHRNTAHGLGLSSSSAHSAAGPPSTSAPADDVMEVEFPEFVEVVTSQLSKAKEERRRKDKETPLPYALLATAYRRKKVMEGLMYDKGGMRSRLLRAKGLAATAGGGGGTPSAGGDVGGAGARGGAAGTASAATLPAKSMWEQLQQLESQKAPPPDSELLSRRRRRRASMAFHDGIDAAEVVNIQAPDDTRDRPAPGGGGGATPGRRARGPPLPGFQHRPNTVSGWGGGGPGTGPLLVGPPRPADYDEFREQVRNELYPLFEMFEARTALPSFGQRPYPPTHGAASAPLQGSASGAPPDGATGFGRGAARSSFSRGRARTTLAARRRGGGGDQSLSTARERRRKSEAVREWLSARKTRPCAEDMKIKLCAKQLVAEPSDLDLSYYRVP